MPELQLDLRQAREYDRVRSHAQMWQLRAAMAREHTLDLVDESRQWQREARTLIECSRRLAAQWALLRARAR